MFRNTTSIQPCLQSQLNTKMRCFILPPPGNQGGADWPGRTRAPLGSRRANPDLSPRLRESRNPGRGHVPRVRTVATGLRAGPAGARPNLQSESDSLSPWRTHAVVSGTVTGQRPRRVGRCRYHCRRGHRRRDHRRRDHRRRDHRRHDQIVAVTIVAVTKSSPWPSSPWQSSP